MDHRYTSGRFKVTAHHCCASICFTIRQKHDWGEEVVADLHDSEAWQKWLNIDNKILKKKFEYETWTKMLKLQVEKLVRNHIMTQKEADALMEKWKSRFPQYNLPEEVPSIEVTEDYEKLKNYREDLAKRTIKVESVKVD